MSSYNIGVFRDMLESYGFFSTHKSHLVNNSHITRYLKDGTVVLSDGSNAPVARRRKEDFMEQVVKYLKVF
ncbi:MAG: two-component system LytT family response regulator [Saprospiraceae bacterium]